MNKKLMVFSLVGIFAIALVTAGYIVNTLTLNVGVAEPFTVQYAMLGDGGDYDPITDGLCSANNAWINSGDTVATGNMFPEESRKFCVKIENEGEAPITYSVTSKVETGHENYAECALAFPETTIYGIVPGESIIKNGQAFTVPGDAPKVGGCVVTIEIARGVEGPVQGTTEFTQKDLTTWIPYGLTDSIDYTMIGDQFVATGIPTGYTLVYYPDMKDFATSIANILVYGIDEFPGLPIEGYTDNSYCTNGFNPDAKVCNGAKLWLIPTDTLSNLQGGSWADAASFLFETDLITYTKTA